MLSRWINRELFQPSMTPLPKIKEKHTRVSMMITHLRPSPQGSIWKLVDPAVLAKEKAQKEAEEARKAEVR